MREKAGTRRTQRIFVRPLTGSVSPARSWPSHHLSPGERGTHPSSESPEACAPPGLGRVRTARGGRGGASSSTGLHGCHLQRVLLAAQQMGSQAFLCLDPPGHMSLPTPEQRLAAGIQKWATQPCPRGPCQLTGARATKRTSGTAGCYDETQRQPASRQGGGLK